MVREHHARDDAEERKLFRRLADGDLSSEEFHELEQRLLSDESFRNRYVMAMGMESALYQVHSGVREPVSQFRENSHPGSSSRTLLFFPLALCASLLLAIGLFFLTSEDSPKHAGTKLPETKMIPSGSETDAINSEVEKFPVITFTEIGSGISDDAAIITQIEAGNSLGELIVGQRLKPGVLTIQEGTLRLEFLFGAQLILKAPATLQIQSASSAKLISGQAAARIPPHAQGFVLNAPDAAVVDLGTEFAVSVSEQGQSEVHVEEGKVEVSLLGNDGTTYLSEQLEAVSTLRVSRDRSALESIERPSVFMPAFEVQTASPLRVPESYVQEVLTAQPLIYWRFESLENGQIPNEVQEKWAAQLVDKCQEPAVWVENGFVRFAAGKSSRYFDVKLKEPLPELNKESYSLELWFNPDHLHFSTLLNISPTDKNFSHHFLSHIELAYQTQFVHTPGTVRFLYRSPPHRNSTKGINLFSPEGCTPGQWHHVVTVKTPGELKLYFNGKLVKKVEAPQEGDEAPYRLILGQHKWNTIDRQFVGAIDEFALYLRELTETEVLHHYELITTPDQLSRTGLPTRP